MVSFQIPLLMVAIGLPVWIAGSIAESVAARRAGQTTNEWPFVGTLYGLTSIGALGVYLYVSFLDDRSGHRALGVIWREIVQTPLTGDPVLNFIIWALAVAVAVALIPGMIGAGFYLIAVLLGLVFFVGLVVAPLIALAKMSLVGAIVAGILVVLPLIWLFRKYRDALARVVWKVFEPAYGILFDWWLTPRLRRRKEQRLMDDVRNKQSKTREALNKLVPPEVPADVPLAPLSTDESWLARIAERVRLRGQQINNQEKIKIAGQAKQYFAETRGAIDEYRGVLEASDELERVQRGDSRTEKDEEAEIRRLDRQKRTVSLTQEIKDLKKKPEAAKDEYREKQEAKKSRRRVDIADNLFEQLEIPSITRVEGQKLYDRRRLEVLSDKALSPSAKAEELTRIEKDFRDWLKKHNFSIFEDDD